MAISPAQIQQYLGGVSYPASRDDLVSHAEASGADDEVLSTLERMPGDSFETPADVSQALGDIM